MSSEWRPERQRVGQDEAAGQAAIELGAKTAWKRPASAWTSAFYGSRPTSPTTIALTVDNLIEAQFPDSRGADASIVRAPAIAHAAHRHQQRGDDHTGRIALAADLLDITGAKRNPNGEAQFGSARSSVEPARSGGSPCAWLQQRHRHGRWPLTRQLRHRLRRALAARGQRHSTSRVARVWERRSAGAPACHHTGAPAGRRFERSAPRDTKVLDAAAQGSMPLPAPRPHR